MKAAACAAPCATSRRAILNASRSAIAPGASGAQGRRLASKPCSGRNRIKLVGDAPRTYRHVSDKSGRWLDQAFCSICGTNIGFTLEAVPGVRTIAAGTFDDPSWLTSEKYAFRHVYVRSARDWSEIPDGVERHAAHFRK